MNKTKRFSDFRLEIKSNHCKGSFFSQELLHTSKHFLLFGEKFSTLFFVFVVGSAGLHTKKVCDYQTGLNLLKLSVWKFKFLLLSWQLLLDFRSLKLLIFEQESKPRVGRGWYKNHTKKGARDALACSQGGRGCGSSTFDKKNSPSS